MRFLGSVVDGGGALRAGGGEHHVDRAADGRHVQEHVAAGERLRLCDDRATGGLHLSAERAHALDVLVDRTATDVASAGQRYAGAAKARQQRTDIIGRSAHAAGKIKRYVGTVDGRGVDLHQALFGIPVHLGAQVTQRLHGDVDVLDVGQVFNHAGRAAQDRGGDDGDRGILAAADADDAFQPVSACDEHSLFVSHACPPLLVC